MVLKNTIDEFSKAFERANTLAERAYVYHAVAKWCDQVKSSCEDLGSMMGANAINDLLGRKSNLDDKKCQKKHKPKM